MSIKFVIGYWVWGIGHWALGIDYFFASPLLPCLPHLPHLPCPPHLPHPSDLRLKELPQPQVAIAWGFWKRKPPPMRSSE
jgi:hypothetical protein